jgi:hypothetical protein
MYSKTPLIATFLLALFTSCSIGPPKGEVVPREVNVAFDVEKNLILLRSVTVAGRPGRFIFGSASERTALDSSFVQSLPPSTTMTIELGRREAVSVTPVILDLQGAADGIVGADVCGNHAITLDYRVGLLTFQEVHPEGMTTFRFADEPSIEVFIDGTPVMALVDTASADTLTVPRAARPASRTMAHVMIAGNDMGLVDIRLGDVTAPHIGNRLLSKFLLTIDYGRKQVGVWRDPRTRL